MTDGSSRVSEVVCVAWSTDENKGCYFWREATVVFFSVVRIWLLFDQIGKRRLYISNTNKYINKE